MSSNQLNSLLLSQLFFHSTSADFQLVTPFVSTEQSLYCKLRSKAILHKCSFQAACRFRLYFFVVLSVIQSSSFVPKIQPETVVGELSGKDLTSCTYRQSNRTVLFQQHSRSFQFQSCYSHSFRQHLFHNTSLDLQQQDLFLR